MNIPGDVQIQGMPLSDLTRVRAELYREAGKTPKHLTGHAAIMRDVFQIAHLLRIQQAVEAVQPETPAWMKDVEVPPAASTQTPVVSTPTPVVSTPAPVVSTPTPTQAPLSHTELRPRPTIDLAATDVVWRMKELITLGRSDEEIWETLKEEYAAP
jgi:hypothetical protein